MSRNRQLEQLTQKLDKLKREYDSFLSGKRRTEPTNLHREVEREILMLTRSPDSSTAFKFHVRTLANKYRSFETQMRNIIERRNRWRAKSGDPNPEVSQELIIDEMVINNPNLMDNRLKMLLRKTAGGQDISSEQLLSTLVGKAKSVVGKNNVKAVSFKLVKGEKGPRVSGKAITVSGDKSS